MSRHPNDKGFALLTIRQELPSIDHIFGWYPPSILHVEQDLFGIAGFSGNANFPAITKIIPKKILTSQISQALHEMAYFDVKGQGENDKYQNRAELQ
jgi:hypothetical protein